MKRIIITSVIIIAVLAGIMYKLNANKAKNESQTAVVAQKNAAVAVRVADASYQDMKSTYVANGVFEPTQEVFISTEVAGKVTRVLVNEGSRVGAGQTLAIIKGEKQDVAVSNAQAIYNNAVNEVTRFENAYKTGGVTKQQLDQIKLQMVTAKNNLQSANISAGDVNVRASFSGIINKRNIEPGSYVNPGTQMFEIVNIGTLKLNVNVDEKSIGNLKLGQNVTIQSSVFPDQKWNGKVSFIAPKADASLNFPVEIELKNNGVNELKAGMYGTAIFGDDQIINALVVPRTAFVGNISSNKIFIIEKDKAILKNVVTGRVFNDFVEIISGINNGDKVITSGQINLFNETPVSIIQ